MTVIFHCIVVTVILVTALWGISLLRRDASIADAYWSFGFAVISCTSWLSGHPDNGIGLLLIGLTGIWALRHVSYMVSRNLREGEDRRYQDMRAGRGKSFWWQSYYVVFLFQGGLQLLIAAPIMTCAAFGSAQPNVLTGLGVIFFLIGFLFEAVADAQLNRFRKHADNHRKTMQSGLWNYSRHPNYFGNIVMMWALFVIGFSVTGLWWTILSPLLVTFLLLKVSGVPMTEEHMFKTREDFADYVRRTSALFPLPPKT